MTNGERATVEMSSLGQGIALLDAVVRRERSGRSGLSVSKLADATNIERSRVSRLSQELLDLGLIEKSADGRLRVGPSYLMLAASRHDAWLRRARKDLRRLASSYRASLRVLAPEGPRAVLLRFESGPGAPESAIRPGMVTPIWSTGGGRALLWGSGEEEIQRLLADSRFVGVGGPNASKSIVEVSRRMAADRRRGVVEAVEEFEYGVVELAAPVRDRGQVIASVSAACRIDDTEARVGLSREVVSVAVRLGDLAHGGSEAADQLG